MRVRLIGKLLFWAGLHTMSICFPVKRKPRFSLCRIHRHQLVGRIKKVLCALITLPASWWPEMHPDSQLGLIRVKFVSSITARDR